MINCSLCNKRGEQNEQFKSSEHGAFERCSVKEEGSYRQRQGKVTLMLLPSSLQQKSLWPKCALLALLAHHPVV
jgi:hypothetical protein